MWDRKVAGRPREGWGNAEWRLGFGQEPSAPDLWGQEQWLDWGCLACCLGTSLFSFPALISLSSPHLLPLLWAHPVHWLLDSTFHRADFFPEVVSAHSHSEVGSKAGTGQMWKGGPGGPPCGLGSALRPKGT